MLLKNCSSSHFCSACGNREHPGNFQNKSLSSPFNWVYRYLLFLAKLKMRGMPFLEVARKGTALWDYPQEHLVVIKDEKVCPFGKFEIILFLLCCLLDPLTNNHCRTWLSLSLINLWIDCRTCQKKKKTTESCCQQGKIYFQGKIKFSYCILSI